MKKEKLRKANKQKFALLKYMVPANCVVQKLSHVCSTSRNFNAKSAFSYVIWIFRHGIFLLLLSCFCQWCVIQAKFLLIDPSAIFNIPASKYSIDVHRRINFLIYIDEESISNSLLVFLSREKMRICTVAFNNV